MRFQTEQTDNYQCSGDNIEYGLLTYPVNVDILQEVLHQFSGKAERFSILALSISLQPQTSQEDSRQEGRDNTNHVRNSETFDGACTEDSEDSTCQERGHVSVHNSGDSTLETVLNRLAQILTGFHFLTDTLVDKHVSIDGHTHRQYDTGNTRQSQYSREGS